MVPAAGVWIVAHRRELVDQIGGNRVPARDEQRGRKGEGDVHPVVARNRKDMYEEPD